MRVAVLFIDGVGVGPRDPRFNPLARAPFLVSWFDDQSGTALPDHGRRHLVDTTFELRGRPQSASNQAALYTGLDAPRLVGGHVLGYPNAALRTLLAEHSIARRLTSAARSTVLANAYPAAFLALVGLPHAAPAGPLPVLDERLRRRARQSASTLALAAAGATFFTFDDALEGRGLTHDLDGQRATRRGFAVPRHSPTEAAEVFWRVAGDFTLFEHFLADEAGHLQQHDAAASALATFDAFAREVIARRPADCCVIICSDHGNVEDLRTRNHTTNPVCVLTFGAPATHVPLRTVADVGQLVLDLSLRAAG
jgi:hypothetical protein